MQTKAELEAEIVRLRIRVAELEGAIEAYKFTVAHFPYSTSAPAVNTNDWWWQPQAFQPSTFPIVTS
jgi:hypothetical protein